MTCRRPRAPSLLDVAHRRWSTEVADAAEIPLTWLPRLYEGPDICARISAEGAAATGLAEGTPVATPAQNDQGAGAVGMGIVGPGSGFCHHRHQGVVFASTDKPTLDPLGRLHTFCHAAPGLWHVMGVTNGAGLSLRWLRDTFATGFPYDLLTDDAARIPAGCEGMLWAPYLFGERTPHLDPSARAAFTGITASHGRAHFTRAVMEGVAMSLRDTLTLFAELHIPVTSIRLGGGGARSPLWQQIQADVYGQPVELLAADEGGAFGAALLAAVGKRRPLAPAWEAACAATVPRLPRPSPPRTLPAISWTQPCRPLPPPVSCSKADRRVTDCVCGNHFQRIRFCSRDRHGLSPRRTAVPSRAGTDFEPY